MRTTSRSSPSYFIDGFNAEFKKRVQRAEPAALGCSCGYGWPGNVRELRNVVERAMLLSRRERLDAADFAVLEERRPLPPTASNCPPGARPRGTRAQPGRPGAPALRRATRRRRPRLLGLNRDQIRYRIEKFGLTVSH